MKKNIIAIIGIILLILAAGSFYWFSQNQSSSVSSVADNGVSFAYPKTAAYQKKEPSVSTSHYDTHTISGSGQSSESRSKIQILIPTADAPGETAPLSERLKDFPKELSASMPHIEQLRLDGRNAERLVIDNALFGGSPDLDPTTTTIVQVMSKYPDSYIVLSYQQYKNDPSLNDAWSMILSSLKMK